MLQDIVSAKPLEDYKLYLQFEDGVKGVVDIKELIEFIGVFEPLRDQKYFRQVEVNPEIGTIQWPNEADLDPDVLYSVITGRPIIPDTEIESVSGHTSGIANTYQDWADIIQITAFHSKFSNGSLPLTDGIKILESTKKIIEAAALSTIEPRSFYQGPRFQQARDYLGKVLIGQTEQGSYIFNIISPLDSGEDSNSYKSENDSFERKVVKTLFRALANLGTFPEREEDLINAVNQGISGNLCDAIAGMGGTEEELDFGFRLMNSQRQPLINEIPREIIFPAKALPKIRKLGSQLKKRKISPGNHIAIGSAHKQEDLSSLALNPSLTQVEGFVVRLEWLGGDRKAKVTILATIENKNTEIVVELDKKSYLVAVQANLEQSSVMCSGLLTYEEDSWVMQDVQSFLIQKY
jgi:hypothetical protein